MGSIDRNGNVIGKIPAIDRFGRLRDQMEMMADGGLASTNQIPSSHLSSEILQKAAMLSKGINPYQ
jgi:hypothetical protein